MNVVRKIKNGISIILDEIGLLFKLVIVRWPTGYIGNKLRCKYYSRRLKFLGENPGLHFGVKLDNPDLITIGKNCLFGEEVTITAGNCNGIFIGRDVAISNRSYIRSAIHRFDRIDISILEQGYTTAKIQYNGSVYSIVIEDEVWIGSNAIILSGANIGKGCMISAGAMVSNTIPPYSIVVGNPGRVIGNRLKKIENNEKV
jgi:acetyltransferase-like isoleucine patch superfamily enzyme